MFSKKSLTYMQRLQTIHTILIGTLVWIINFALLYQVQNEKGKSIVTYEYNNKCSDTKCDLFLTYISIHIINKNVTEENDTYPSDKPIHTLEQMYSNDGHNQLHNKYINCDIIISELINFIESSNKNV